MFKLIAGLKSFCYDDCHPRYYTIELNDFEFGNIVFKILNALGYYADIKQVDGECIIIIDTSDI